jgi:hydrogenase maturation protease
MTARVLVGGIGNVFLGDDGFGVEVVRRLRSQPLPPGVDLVDFGIRGIDLAYALAEYDAAVLVDAAPRGGPGGTLYVLEPSLEAGDAALQMHSMTLDRVLRWIPEGTGPRVLRIVGCEPVSLGPPGEGEFGLSEPVLAAVEGAVRLVQSLVGELTGEAARA